MRFLNRIFLLLVSIALLTASSGVSLLVHHCNSAKKTGYLAFPEFHQKSGTSCCSLKNSVADHSSSKPSGFSKASCCSLNKITLRIPPFKIPVQSKPPVVELVLSPACESYLSGIIPDLKDIRKTDPPPLPEPLIISGKDIVYFNQQLRIPLSC